MSQPICHQCGEPFATETLLRVHLTDDKRCAEFQRVENLIEVELLLAMAAGEAPSGAKEQG